MKTITRLGTNVSLYVFDDNIVVNIQDNQTVIGDPVTLYIADCNLSNVVLFENVTPPDDWCGHKYLYTVDNGWELNPAWVDPDTESTP